MGAPRSMPARVGAIALGLALAAPAWAQQAGESGLWRLASLRDHNTRVVLLGTAMLGLAAGVVGSFLLLRKRALVGDAVSHATLPGIGVAFLLGWRLGGDGKSLPWLLLGAAVAGVLGMITVVALRRFTRIKEDAALGVVLSVYFGLGMAILGIIQGLPGTNAAGLTSFIYGKTAAMLARDAWLIAAAALVAVVAAVLLFKELALLCFDQDYAASQGWPVGLLDGLLMGLAVAITVIGLQAVGLILVIAMLILPPAAARFWTEDLRLMVVVAAVVGLLSGLVGAGLSSLNPNLPSGALIVLTAAAAFAVSLVAGARRGLARRAWERLHLDLRVARENLLRAMYELAEAHAGETRGRVTVTTVVPRADLARARSWSPRQWGLALWLASSAGLVRANAAGNLTFSDAGLREARRVVRNHRLWELYLLTHADVATGHVDHGADDVEHVLGPELTGRLEQMLRQSRPDLELPGSPHPTAGATP